MEPHTLFQQPTTEEIAARLRRIRRAKGWSLGDVELASKGAIKAVVLGSYERCDRALSIKRAIELTTFFDVPFSTLFEDTSENASPNTRQSAAKLILDLRALKSAPSGDRMYIDFTSWIITQRSDWNGEVLSIRASDLSILALLARSDCESVKTYLINHKYLLTGSNLI